MIENAGGELLAVEVKATATVKQDDLSGLRTFARVAGKQFRMGVLLYDGTDTLPVGEGLWAAPVSSLWGELLTENGFAQLPSAISRSLSV